MPIIRPAAASDPLYGVKRIYSEINPESGRLRLEVVSARRGAGSVLGGASSPPLSRPHINGQRCGKTLFPPDSDELIRSVKYSNLFLVELQLTEQRQPLGL